MANRIETKIDALTKKVDRLQRDISFISDYLTVEPSSNEQQTSKKKWYQFWK